MTYSTEEEFDKKTFFEQILEFIKRFKSISCIPELVKECVEDEEEFNK